MVDENGEQVGVVPVAEALSPELLRRGYGVEARIETCSRGRPLVLADRAARQ